MMSDGTIQVEAAARFEGTILEYSLDQGTTWLENDGLFTGLAAGTYQPREWNRYGKYQLYIYYGIGCR